MSDLRAPAGARLEKSLTGPIFVFKARQTESADNIIVMVDEVHHTQEGDLGEKMRMALPNAFFFGLTGTPIKRTDKNTFATFGAEFDRSGYMNRYSFSDSIRGDGARFPFDGWKSTTAGTQEVRKALRSVVWIKYKIKDQEVFDKAYNYIEQYY
ncbi:MAG: hypothetical protein PUB69_06885 [Desulfovibrionaceae bacterium]|nr:hypothetical protein [Desulfovibrionaceae bacterium]